MTKTKFIVFTAEPDGEVSSAGGGDALAGGNGNNGNGNGNGDGGGGGGGAWRLVARAPVVIQTALPCACEYVLSNPDGTVAARGVVEPGVPAHVTSAGRGGGWWCTLKSRLTHSWLEERRLLSTTRQKC